jgi:hypothetical protein
MNKRMIYSLTLKIGSIAALMLFAATLFAATPASQSSNVSVVRQQKFKYPSESIGVLMHAQHFCVSLKKAAYEQMGKQYTPPPSETLTARDITALFDIKVEEHFQGTDYARIDSGRRMDFKKFVDDTKSNADIEKLNCKIASTPFTIITIEKLDKHITIQTTKDGGQVEINEIPKHLHQYRTVETPFEFVKVLDVNRSKYKCGLNENMQWCYLKDLQVHPGTGKRVVVQIIAPEPGSKHDDPLNAERDAFYDPFKGTVRGAYLMMIEDNVSITVGEPIPADKFEIPDFAKNFKIIPK